MPHGGSVLVPLLNRLAECLEDALQPLPTELPPAPLQGVRRIAIGGLHLRETLCHDRIAAGGDFSRKSSTKAAETATQINTIASMRPQISMFTILRIQRNPAIWKMTAISTSSLPRGSVNSSLIYDGFRL